MATRGKRRCGGLACVSVPWAERLSFGKGDSALAKATRTLCHLHHEQRTRWGGSGGKLWHVQARRDELCMWLRARTSKVALRKASPGRARRRRAIELEEHGGQARGATAWAVYAGARVSQQWPAATRGLGKRREQPPGFCFFQLGSARPRGVGGVRPGHINSKTVICLYHRRRLSVLNGAGHFATVTLTADLLRPGCTDAGTSGRALAAFPRLL